MFNKIKRKIQDAPIFKTIIGIFSLIIVSVLSGAFITEINIDGKLCWMVFYKARSFYGLIIFGFLIYFYYRFLYSYDKSIINFKDDAYCKAYMRKECLPELAKKAKKLIKSGKSTEEIKNIIKDLNL